MKVYESHARANVFLTSFFLMTCFAWPSTIAGAGLVVDLTPSAASGQPVGMPIVWTATVTGPTGIVPMYKFSVTPPNGSSANVVRDYSSMNTLQWTSLTEGTYQISVRAADALSGAYGDGTNTFVFTTRITAGVPVVSGTEHPLVALYSAPPCSAGSVKVFFRPVAAGGLLSSAPAQSCEPGASLNFYVAGMKANTTYAIEQLLVNGTQSVAGPVLFFETGSIQVSVPKVTMIQPPESTASTSEDVYLLADFTVKPPQTPPLAVDLSGNIIWYYPAAPTDPLIGLVRPAHGGTMLSMLAGDRGGVNTLAQILRETDLAGGLVRETNVTTLGGQLQAVGQDKIGWISHEALRLPNGHTLILGSAERLLTDVQGPGQVDVVGDVILDLDQNFQVGWTWNAFQFLDTTRKAPLGELCTTKYVFDPTTYICPLQKASVANDWTHGNALAYVASDGSLLLSIRNQDWIIKIDYNNGAGTGKILWRMGIDGDFLPPTSDLSSWFSHQHGIQFDGTHLAVFDNGNTRIAQAGTGDSRGQVLTFDEASLTTNLLVNFDMGSYSPADGIAQRLANGDYQFLSALILDQPPTQAQSIEVQPDGTANYSISFSSFGYRGFRMTDLYSYNP